MSDFHRDSFYVGVIAGLVFAAITDGAWVLATIQACLLVVAIMVAPRRRV